MLTPLCFAGEGRGEEERGGDGALLRLIALFDVACEHGIFLSVLVARLEQVLLRLGERLGARTQMSNGE